jgi:uncharacterized protein (DUF2062 family)
MWGWFKRRVLIPIRQALRNGISQKRLAVSLALGITVGLIPFYGLTTILVGALALSLRLDFIVMQVVHYLVHPIQIALFVPFFKAGNYFFSDDTVNFTIKEYLSYLKSDFGLAISEFWKMNLSAVAVWLIISIPLFYLLYYAFIYSLNRYAGSLIRRPRGKY